MVGPGRTRALGSVAMPSAAFRMHTSLRWEEKGVAPNPREGCRTASAIWHWCVVPQNEGVVGLVGRQDTIDRVQELEKQGRLSGVMDDRGKFIYISRCASTF